MPIIEFKIQIQFILFLTGLAGVLSFVKSDKNGYNQAKYHKFHDECQLNFTSALRVYDARSVFFVGTVREPSKRMAIFTETGCSYNSDGTQKTNIQDRMLASKELGSRQWRTIFRLISDDVKQFNEQCPSASRSVNSNSPGNGPILAYEIGILKPTNNKFKTYDFNSLYFDTLSNGHLSQRTVYLMFECFRSRVRLKGLKSKKLGEKRNFRQMFVGEVRKFCVFGSEVKEDWC